MKERGIECPTILSTCELVVDDTVDGKDNKEEETLEVAEGAFPSSELFEVRENIRLLIKSIRLMKERGIECH